MINIEKLKTLDLKSRDKLRAQSILLGKPLIGPQSINIVIVQACDRKCAFCWYFSPMVKNPPKRKILEYEVLERTLIDCQEMGVDEINLEGGEVVLYPHAEKTFHKVKELGMRLRAYSHLDFESKHLKYLALADMLTVNLSAMTEDLYQQVHGKTTGTLHNLLRHLDLLMGLNRKYGKPKITLSFVLYKDNYKQLKAFLDLAQERGVEAIVIRFFKATQDMGALMLDEDMVLELREVVKVVKDYPYTFRHNLQGLWDTISDGMLLDKLVAIDHAPTHNDRLFFWDSTKGKKTRCHVGRYYAHIDEHGVVAGPCDNVGICIAGNIYERSFKDIWFNSQNLNETLVEASEGIKTCNPKWKECRYCSWLSVNKFLDDKVNYARSSRKNT